MIPVLDVTAETKNEGGIARVQRLVVCSIGLGLHGAGWDGDSNAGSEATGCYVASSYYDAQINFM